MDREYTYPSCSSAQLTSCDTPVTYDFKVVKDGISIEVYDFTHFSRLQQKLMRYTLLTFGRHGVSHVLRNFLFLNNYIKIPKTKCSIYICQFRF